MAFYDSLANEMLYYDNVDAYVQEFVNDEWVTKFDIMDSSNNVPENKEQSIIYKIEFSQPVYKVRIYAQSNINYGGPFDLGRICVGNIGLYYSNYNLPVNGYEASYEPEKWNNTNVPGKNETISSVTNCYSYALNTQWNPEKEGDDKFSSFNPKFTSNDQFNKSDYNVESLIEALQFDASNLGSYAYNIDKNEKCREGTYKIAYYYSPNKEDYHFYRQNKDGTWSHKTYNTPVTLLDTSNNLIFDPDECNREYPNGTKVKNYSVLLGYFEIRPLNNYV